MKLAPKRQKKTPGQDPGVFELRLPPLQWKASM